MSKGLHDLLALVLSFAAVCLMRRDHIRNFSFKKACLQKITGNKTCLTCQGTPYPFCGLFSNFTIPCSVLPSGDSMCDSCVSLTDIFPNAASIIFNEALSRIWLQKLIHKLVHVNLACLKATFKKRIIMKQFNIKINDD